MRHNILDLIFMIIHVIFYAAWGTLILGLMGLMVWQFFQCPLFNG